MTLTLITAGEWQSHPLLMDYRTEWLSGALIERATWRPSAPEQRMEGVVTASVGHIWFRFWLVEIEQVIEKYFDSARRLIGYHIPICAAWRRRDAQFLAPHLLLSLWLTPGGRLTVLHEAEFEAAAKAGALTPVEVEQAEQRIREITAGIALKRFPPGLVKTLMLEQKNAVMERGGVG